MMGTVFENTEPAITPVERAPTDESGWKARGPCPCTGCTGTRYVHTSSKEVVCNHCHAVVSHERSRHIDRAQRRWDRQLSPPDHDTYPSGRQRLYGGYTDAYVTEGDESAEYAIDSYDTVTEGLWTPHDRGGPTPA